MKKKIFSFQLTAESKLHQFHFSLSNVLIFSSIFFAVLLVSNYYLSKSFSESYYADQLNATDLKYKSISEELLLRISELENDIKSFEDRDKELRTYAEMPPISENRKTRNTGGSINNEDSSDNPNFLNDLTKKVDDLSFSIKMQKDSYDKIFSKIKANEKMYSHIPSIPPVIGYIGSGYGYRKDPIDGKKRLHSGLDFSVNLNTDVMATGDGVVKKAEYDSGWGRYIKIDHGYSYETVYAHLYKIYVKNGQKVQRGDVIGKSGNSGRAAGFHLHYEVHKNKKSEDPSKYFFTGYID